MFKMHRKIFLGFSFAFLFSLLIISLGCGGNGSAQDDKSVQKNGNQKEINRNFSLAV